VGVRWRSGGVGRRRDCVGNGKNRAASWAAATAAEECNLPGDDDDRHRPRADHTPGQVPVIGHATAVVVTNLAGACSWGRGRGPIHSLYGP
jgi:hypothetical protein